ncbi:hypothetical protein SNEBB_001932 [Seison nebaliae]|nr:hypothetical protein SNEBB_001932 [Seison nebaliae]
MTTIVHVLSFDVDGSETMDDNPSFTEEDSDEIIDNDQHFENSPYYTDNFVQEDDEAIGNSTEFDDLTNKTKTDEHRLYTNLIYYYDPSVRPVLNASTSISVKFNIRLSQIIDLNERNQILTINVWVEQTWKDDNLFWDDEFAHIRTIRLPSSKVWLPDTYMYNSADDVTHGAINGPYVMLYRNGTIFYPVPLKMKSSCKVDITYFPFDDQTCSIRFASWIYSGLQVNFTKSNDGYDLKSYMDNGGWILQNVVVKENVKYYPCCPQEPYPELIYNLTISRRTPYYIFNVIVPCVMLSSLTLMSFWLPTYSGEKVTLGLTCFVAFSVFMLMIAEKVPATSEILPIIGIYLTAVMSLTSVSIIMAVIATNMQSRATSNMTTSVRAPSSLRYFAFHSLAHILLMQQDIQDRITEFLQKEVKLDTKLSANDVFEKVITLNIELRQELHYQLLKGLLKRRRRKLREHHKVKLERDLSENLNNIFDKEKSLTRRFVSSENGMNLTNQHLQVPSQNFNNRNSLQNSNENRQLIQNNSTNRLSTGSDLMNINRSDEEMITVTGMRAHHPPSADIVHLENFLCSNAAQRLITSCPSYDFPKDMRMSRACIDNMVRKSRHTSKSHRYFTFLLQSLRNFLQNSQLICRGKKKNFPEILRNGSTNAFELKNLNRRSSTSHKRSWSERRSFSSFSRTTLSVTKLLDKRRQSKKNDPYHLMTTEQLKQISAHFFAFEWSLIALIIDRTFFWLFFAANLASYIVTLLIVPANKPIIQSDELFQQMVANISRSI